MRVGRSPRSAIPVPLSRLVTVAGARWTIEECFQTGKNEAAIDHYQVRLYPAWYRYMTLAMLALAFLAVTRATLIREPDPDEVAPQKGPTPITHSDLLAIIGAGVVVGVSILLHRPGLTRALVTGENSNFTILAITGLVTVLGFVVAITWLVRRIRKAAPPSDARHSGEGKEVTTARHRKEHG
ncbi:hypothetical protein GCM10023194_17330 [Planotetraspora phitsanulokensis]|uniref:Uncharacterized protein n=1 Tax=Planotetraspora phitsanulokensis TaxID=575192 RepID=A0A8J3TYU7_9ACTN|nr:hypothetical protein Pph01_00970 [Planotetraspora phitsanulokensis]